VRSSLPTEYQIRARLQQTFQSSHRQQRAQAEAKAATIGRRLTHADVLADHACKAASQCPQFFRPSAIIRGMKLQFSLASILVCTAVMAVVLHKRGNLHELDARMHTVETGYPLD
jgi:hypothetical protein